MPRGRAAGGGNHGGHPCAPGGSEDAAELLGRLHAWRRGEKYEPDRAPEPSEFARAVAKGTHLSMEGKPAAGSDEEGLRIVVEAGLADADGKVTAENVKRFELTDGTPAEAQIVGFRADVRADGAGKAGISLLMRTPMAMRPMNDAPATGG